MDPALWSFFFSSPGTPIPYPWDRCFDFGTEILFYKNGLNGTIVIDLRRQVDLGGGLFHTSDMWNELTRNNSNSHQCPPVPENQQNQDAPFLICASCCGPLVYLLAPERVHQCPLCNSNVQIIG